VNYLSTNHEVRPLSPISTNSIEHRQNWHAFCVSQGKKIKCRLVMHNYQPIRPKGY